MKINVMRANIKLLNFHNLLNAPRIVFPVSFDCLFICLDHRGNDFGFINYSIKVL